MHILMLTQFYLPFVGGEELVVQHMSEELVRRGHDVAIATLGHGDAAEYETCRGVRIYRVAGSVQRLPALFADTGRRFVPPLPDPELTWKLNRVLARERPDVVHAHNWMVYSFLPLKVKTKARLVLSLHDYSLVCPRKDYMHAGAPCTGPGASKCLSCGAQHYGLVKGLATVTAHRAMRPIEAQLVDMFLPISRAVAEASGLPGSDLPFQILPEFVTDEVSEPTIDSAPWLAQLPDGPFLLYVGAFRRLKGIEVLLRAHAELVNAPKLVVIGYTCPEPAGPIHFPPPVAVLSDWPNEAVMLAWQRCQIGIVPSLWAEPFGIVALEAMACARPVIASRVGGLTDIVVDGETGYLVPPGDVTALRQAIERLQSDPALRVAMGNAGRRRVKQFQSREVVTRLESIYQRLVGAGHDGNGAPR